MAWSVLFVLMSVLPCWLVLESRKSSGSFFSDLFNGDGGDGGSGDGGGGD